MKPRYSIEIKYGTHAKYSLWWTKHYGDCSGGVTGYDSAEECVQFIKEHVLPRWKSYDSIIGRQPDPVTLENTRFESVVESVNLEQLLQGQQSLSAFGVSA